jgi:predicted GIY-YIG superfamily endonuclease
VNPLGEAVARAPRAPGVYFFLAADRELLYVGKASDLRRRLGEHARDVSRTGDIRRHVMLDAVHRVEWEQSPDVASAVIREADLIVMLKPAFNASHAEQAIDLYVEVRGDARGLSLRLDADRAADGRAYGTFPHLAKGAFTSLAKQTKAGYQAFVRLVGATGSSDAPPAVHDFLSGRSARVLDELSGAVATLDAPVFTRAALEGDVVAARQFFELAPQRLRRLRLRHAIPAGPVSGALMAELLTAELRPVIGDFVPGVAAGGAGVWSPRAARERQLRARLRG